MERFTHTSFDPSVGDRRRNLLRAIMAPQTVKMEDLGSALQTWDATFPRISKKSAKLGEVERADDTKGSAVESTVPESLESHL